MGVVLDEGLTAANDISFGSVSVYHDRETLIVMCGILYCDGIYSCEFCLLSLAVVNKYE